MTEASPLLERPDMCGPNATCAINAGEGAKEAKTAPLLGPTDHGNSSNSQSNTTVGCLVLEGPTSKE